MIIVLGLASAALGMALTMSLVRLFGARRAKTIAQVAAAMIGAGFFLLAQAQNVLPTSQRDALFSWAGSEMKAGGCFSPDSALWWPVGAMLGEPLPLWLVFAIGAGIF